MRLTPRDRQSELVGHGGAVGILIEGDGEEACAGFAGGGHDLGVGLQRPSRRRR